MAKRVTTTITLSEQAHQMLTEIAQHQLRSRSHAIESMIYSYYDKHLLVMPNVTLENKIQHKALTMDGV
jgi:hypothetical protein